MVFTIIIAFYVSTKVKLLDLAFSSKQEVVAASTVFCNMVKATVPSLAGAIIPAGVHRYLGRPFLENPKIMAAVTASVSVVTI